MNSTKTLMVHELILYIYVILIYPKCSILDPCNGVTCGTGLKAVSALGVCQCLQVKIPLIRHAYKLILIYKIVCKKLLSSFCDVYFPIHIDSVPLTQIAQAQPTVKNVLVASVYVDPILNVQEQHPFVDQLLLQRLQLQMLLQLVMYANILYSDCPFSNFYFFNLVNDIYYYNRNNNFYL